MEEEELIPGISIDALRARNKLAFEALFLHYYKPLCYFSERLLKDQPAAEDIVEEIFIKLWDRLEQFESLLHVKRYLYKSCRNGCLDHIKVSQRVDARERTFISSLMDSEDSFDHEFIRSEVLGQIYQAIHQLPAQCGKIMSLSYIDGCQNADISKKLGLSVQTVKNQKTRGLKILQRQLAKLFYLLIIMFLYPF